MAQQQYYRSKGSARRRQLLLARLGLILFTLALLAVFAWLISRAIDRGSAPVADTGEEAGGTVAEAPPLWERVGPQWQSAGEAVLSPPSYESISLPENGRVDMKYFQNAVFVGDSITVGLNYYNMIPGASICAYEGVSPKAIYDGTLHSNQDGVSEAPMEAIQASGARNIYLLLGTNAQIAMDNESILLYYDELLSQLKAALGEKVNIYVQSVTPVLEGTPRFDMERIRAFNQELARLAWQHEVYFLDISSALVGENGYLKEEYGEADGYHLNRAGYTAWLEYLITHTAYNEESKPFYLGQYRPNQA